MRAAAHGCRGAEVRPRARSGRGAGPADADRERLRDRRRALPLAAVAEGERAAARAGARNRFRAVVAIVKRTVGFGAERGEMPDADSAPACRSEEHTSELQ